MSTITAGTQGFVIALVATLVVGVGAVVGQSMLADPGKPADSIGAVLPQVEAPLEADDDPAGDIDDGIPVAGSQDVGEVVASLEADGVAETLDVYLSRDPFQPVVVQASTDGGGSSGDGSSGGGDTSGGGTTIGDNDSGLSCTGSGAEAVCEGTVVTMTGFSDGAALIEVDGGLYTVRDGDVFATSFRVERLEEEDGCAFLRYGDEAFTICDGATILK